MKTSDDENTDDEMLEHFIDSYTSIGDNEKKIIKKHTEDYPIDVEEIARKLKIKVFYEDLSWDISGKITKDTKIRKNTNSSLYYITINKNHHPHRQRFTIAHELGHFFLHKDAIGDGITEDSLYRSESISSWKDIEANRFAAKILMPIELILKLKKQNRNLEYISDNLRVSKSALYIRLGIPY